MKIYREIVRNTAMGAQSVDNIIGYIDCEKMKHKTYKKPCINARFFVFLGVLL